MRYTHSKNNMQHSLFVSLPVSLSLSQGRTILLALQPMYRGFTTISLIFLPKFWLAAVHPDKNTLTSRQTSLAHSHVSTLMDD
mmetsp:Transcript_5839/g.8831  ORF Transcript_5839/g.8831 Transcript_5839/m.8831 type:complete len:83 (-) Transcript_5839:121-369(-)